MFRSCSLLWIVLIWYQKRLILLHIFLFCVLFCQISDLEMDVIGSWDKFLEFWFLGGGFGWVLFGWEKLVKLLKFFFGYFGKLAAKMVDFFSIFAQIISFWEWMVEIGVFCRFESLFFKAKFIIFYEKCAFWCISWLYGNIFLIGQTGLLFYPWIEYVFSNIFIIS